MRPRREGEEVLRHDSPCVLVTQTHRAVTGGEKEEKMRVLDKLNVV